MSKGFIGMMVVIIATALIWFLLSMTIGNTEVRLRNQIAAQQKSNEAVFDNTWKIISQQAQIADEYKESFRQIYPELMAGRYGNARGGALMSWIQESNPNFDTSLYGKLMNSVEAQRITFTREQQKLIDLSREHNNLLQTQPSSWFVGSRSKIDIIIITSDKTDEVFKTHKDNDVELFPKKKDK